MSEQGLSGEQPAISIPKRLGGVASALTSGMSNQRIAAFLGYELHTVENYVSELKSLFSADDRVHLVLILRDKASEIGESTP